MPSTESIFWSSGGVVGDTVPVPLVLGLRVARGPGGLVGAGGFGGFGGFGGCGRLITIVGRGIERKQPSVCSDPATTTATTMVAIFGMGS